MSRSLTAHREISLVRHDEGYFALHYQALGGPCEVLFDHDDPAAVRLAASQAAAETWRIEEKFSRYRKGSVVGSINAALGSEIQLDDESCALIDYAHACHALSEGRFDITSGGLRRVWRFDGKGKLPSPRAVAACLPLIGWDKLRWQRPSLWLPKGMEIDLGGIGKEYAVDRVAQSLQAAGMAHALVNFGGDLRVTGPRRDGRPWMIGIEHRARRPSDQRRCSPLHRRPGSALRPHSRSAYRLAGSRRATFRERPGRHLSRGGNDGYLRHPQRGGCRRLFAITRGSSLCCQIDLDWADGSWLPAPLWP